jgi:hypothetical protein
VLLRSTDRRDEQVAIGIGARMANGVLIATLATLLLEARGATTQEQLGLVSGLALVFGLSFLTLVARPQDAVLGYKG